MFTSLNLTIQFGVFLPARFQLLDAIGPVDYINSNARGFLAGLSGPVPEAYIAQAPAINWHWVSAGGNLEPVQASVGPPLTPTANFTSAPQIDYLLVPGTNVYREIPAEATEWLKMQYPGLKALLTVCTGSLYLSQTGLLDGVRAATNKGVLKRIASGPDYGKFSKVKWVPDARFVVDGKIWTAAGVTSGLDLAAEFVRAHVDAEVVKEVLESFEYVPNPARPDPYAYLLDGVQL